MHNVTLDQVEKNKQLIALVKEYPQIYNHNPTLQHSGETLEEIWAKIGVELGEPRKNIILMKLFYFVFLYDVIIIVCTRYTCLAAVCKKKWRLLRSSLLRYLKVFKDKATSKGNRYRPYYLLEHMDFLMPFIGILSHFLLNLNLLMIFTVDDKTIIRRVKPSVVKSESSSPSGSTTVTIVKKDRSTEEPQTSTILYSSPNTITYNVVATSSSKDSQSSQDNKVEVQQQTQDIQQYYNAGVKIIGGEEYITTYQPGEQIIYQATSNANEEQQIQHQECIQEQHEQQQELVQHNDTKTTLIPIPNISSICADAANPTEASDLYFLIGLLPDFRNLNHDQKRKVKIGILRVLDDAIVT